jgi:hypothetical protein
MTFPLSQYVLIKNRYCLSYFGDDKNVVNFLLHARKQIESHYSGVQVYILVKDKLKPIGKKNIITESGMTNYVNKLACIREITNIEDIKNLLDEILKHEA